MGVSKQDWKDYQSNQWLGGQSKSTYDTLNQEFDAVVAAIDGGDVATFLAYTEDDGKLMQAAENAMNASKDALTAIEGLALKGNQRRFANKNAISTSDEAIGALNQYSRACGMLVEDLVRGVRLEHEEVARNNSAISNVKDGDLKDRLRDAQLTLKIVYDHATDKVAALAAIDKIGVL